MAISVQDLDLPAVDAMSLDRAGLRQALVDAQQRHLLARGPISYLVTRYEDVVAVLRDQRWHNAVGLITQLQGVSDERLLQDPDRPSILAAEGATHSRLRRLVAPAFTPKAADRLRPFMRTVINDLVDEVAPRGRAEFVGEVCEPYPIPIICELLGAPREDWKLFSRWAGDIFRIFNNNVAEDADAIVSAREELDAYTSALIDERRASPRDDLLSDMIKAEEHGDRLDRAELVMMTEAVLLAGTDTTRNQLGCSVALFSEHPKQWEQLAADADLAGRAVEESMRVLGTIRGTGRFASEDIEYKDVSFPKGTLLFPSFIAANNDASVFEHADAFDISRTDASPHLTFGSGIHFCLGAWLARAELQEALPILARRMPGMARDGEIEWKPDRFGIWGPARLPLRFEAGH